jgi:hypothetical protein
MMDRFTGAGGLVACSTSTRAKRRDVIARVFGQNGIEGSAKRRFFAVLHVPPVDSPEKAVRAAIVHDYRSGKANGA